MSGNFSKFPESGKKSVHLDDDDEIQILSIYTPNDQKKRKRPESNQMLKQEANQRNQNGRKNIKHSDNPKDDSLESNTDVCSWHIIQIPHAKRYGRGFILESITSKCKNEITPFNFQFHGHTAEFCVKYEFMAANIKKLDQKIIFPDGRKMVIHSKKIKSPKTTAVDSELLQVLQDIVNESYDSNNRCLNISKFHDHRYLKINSWYINLKQWVILHSVMKIIKESIPKIEVLNISNNYLSSLEAVHSLRSICKQLRSVNLQNNRLWNISELNYLNGLQLDELLLDGNPLCDDYKNKASYIRAVRERFPMLMRLDDHIFDDAIVEFDMDLNILPASKKQFFPADEVKDLVMQFLDLYCSIYDSVDRKTKLLDPYHDQASFSLCLSKNTQKTGQYSLGPYSIYNRNLLIVRKNAERCKLLKKGKLAVVNTLHDLPQTRHYTSSFSVDIFHVSPGMMSFSVLGVFKEVGAGIENATLKTFYRTFVVVPRGSGFVIINETLFIDHASTKQQSKAINIPARTRSPSPAPPTDEKNPIQKRLLVLELCKRTKMNSDFSTKCLEENDWDLQKSLDVFMKFLKECKLPPEAFIT